MAGLEQRVKPQILRDAEAELPTLLQERVVWYGAKLHSSPRVHRVYRPWRNGFLFLHELHEDPEHISTLHRHFGNMWVVMEDGGYDMHLARESQEKPTAYVRQRIKAGDWYFMGPNDWHRILPTTRETQSLVIVQDWIPPAITNVRGEWMRIREVDRQLDMFKGYYS